MDATKWIRFSALISQIAETSSALTGTELFKLRLTKFYYMLGGHNYLFNLKTKYNLQEKGKHLSFQETLRQFQNNELGEEWSCVKRHYPDAATVINATIQFQEEMLQIWISSAKALAQELFSQVLPNDAFDSDNINNFKVNGNKIIYSTPKKMYYLSMLGTVSVEENNHEMWIKQSGYGNTDHMFT